jgi:MATE family multidrug resistance protein
MVAVPAWLLLWRAEPVLLALGQDPQLAADAQTFMRELQWGFLPALGFIALRSFVTALERPIGAMMVTMAAILFNVAANWALVFGHLGFPALELRGSGLATTLSSTFMFLGLVAVVLTDRRFRRYRLFGRWWRPDWPRLVTLWRLGVPIGVTMALEVTLFNAAVFLMGLFGVAAIAAHSIAIQIASASFMVPLGVGQAATVRVGLAHGAHDRDGISRAGWAAFVLAIAFMALMSVLLLALPRMLIGIFVETADPANAAVVETAMLFLLWAAIFQMADGAQVVGAGMLRGLQDTRVPMLYAAFGYWGCGMPLSLLFAFKLGFQGAGIWMGLASGLATVAILMISRWVRRERLGLVA